MPAITFIDYDSVLDMDRPDRDQAAILRGDAGAMHRTVMSLFPDGTRDLGVLWREEPGGVLIRSAREPHFIPSQAQTKPEPELPEGADLVGFTLTVSAVRDHHGRRRPIGDSDVPEWIDRKLAPALTGIALAGVRRDTAPVTRKGSRPFRIDRSRVHGTAHVADHDALRTLISAGVGRERAFGCGLLTAVPLS
ncbi:MAG: type I-E CRISPR-associated protein Cas6/Cse3/CasE [Microbacteriaceae bacterium]